MPVIARSPDGYYHPASEDELVALVAHAHDADVALRVRGSSHSVSTAIYTDGFDGQGAPPAGPINVMLDRYRGFTITPEADPAFAIVSAEAGCHLGKDPYDPTGTSTWQNSLDFNLQHAGYAFDDLGGISHQTISGFLSTGSSGGSLAYSIYDAIVRIRFIDGKGQVHEVSRDDADPAQRDLFFAAGVSFGLLGVISKVWVRVGRSYNILGTQITTTADAAPVDLFGEGSDATPSLERFLRAAPYTRLMWWPQWGFHRMQIWQAARIEAQPSFDAQPYLELGTSPTLASLAGSLFYTLIGNLDDVAGIPDKLTAWKAHLLDAVEGEPDVNACKAPAPAPRYSVKDVITFLSGPIHRALEQHAAALAQGGTGTPLPLPLPEVEEERDSILERSLLWLLERLIDQGLESRLTGYFADKLQDALPYLIPEILGLFVQDGTQVFWDTWMCGLPMDNQMDDQLWPTDFTELWIPVERAGEVMRALKTFYDAGGDASRAYEHTGAFSCELYAAKKSPFWLSPSHEKDMFRVDVFWFGLNAGDPARKFYPQFWELLKDFDFRPHWGKYLPAPHARWRAHYREVYPKLGDFLTLREGLDPKGIFLTSYWRDVLGIG